MTELLYRPDASADVQEAFEWYERRRAGLGRDFLRELGEAEEALVRAPMANRAVHRETRRYLMHRFPYQLLYRVIDDTVVIVGCFHVRRSQRDVRNR